MSIGQTSFIADDHFYHERPQPTSLRATNDVILVVVQSTLVSLREWVCPRSSPLRERAEKLSNVGGGNHENRAD
jgi:hypothetical protein